MENRMNSFRAYSAPSSMPSSPDRKRELDNSNLEGVTATVKLLMKLIQDHKSACVKEQNDSRKMLRVAGMMTILDNVKTRIQKSQSFGHGKREAELRRCQTELHRSGHVPRDKKLTEPIDEVERLKKELNASFTVRKNLEAMCSSLGKEKGIMANELARKVHEIGEMEELVNDLKEQNDKLLSKIKEKKHNGMETNHSNVILQERNKALSEQLLRSLDGYKSMKRKLKEANEENRAMRVTMEEMGSEIGASLERIRGFKQKMTIKGEPTVDIEEDTAELEHMFECFQIKVSKYEQKKGECVKPKSGMSARNPSVLS